MSETRRLGKSEPPTPTASAPAGGEQQGGLQEESSGETSGDNREPRAGRTIGHYLGQYAVVIVMISLFLLFSILKPDTFFTTSNVEAVLATQAVLVILAMGLTVALAAGEFDLSVAAVVGLSAAVLAFLTSVHHWPVGLAIPVVFLFAVSIGGLNALFVVRFKVNSFITTLGSGTLVTGLALGITGTTTIGNVPASLTDPAAQSLGGIKLPVYFAIALTLLLWFTLEYTVWGRHLLFTGMSVEAARLAGVPVARIRCISLVLSAGFAGISGMVLLGQTGAASPTYGASFLLPAFAAAFLGATTIKTGRYNAWGTLVGVYLLAIGTTGLQMLGATNWVSNVFNGGALMVAVAFAVLAARGQQK